MALKRPADELLFTELPSKVHRIAVDELDDASWSVASPVTLELIAKDDGMRILRAEEREGPVARIHDFLVFLGLHKSR